MEFQIEQFKADYLAMTAREVAKKYEKKEAWVYSQAKRYGIVRPKRRRTTGSTFCTWN